jgi:hypothetical protein
MVMSKRVSQRVAELWKLHRAQQSFYKVAMGEEIPGDLRSLCGKGYLITSVCMSEISEIYDQVKCPIGDRVLQPSIKNAPSNRLGQMPDGSAAERVIHYLRFRQGKVLRKYAKILSHFEVGEAYLKVLNDHMFVLNGLADKLERVKN